MNNVDCSRISELWTQHCLHTTPPLYHAWPFFHSSLLFTTVLFIITLLFGYPLSLSPGFIWSLSRCHPVKLLFCFYASHWSAWPVSSVKALRNYSQWLFSSAWAYIEYLADTWGAPRSARLLLLYLPYTSVNRNILLHCLEKAKVLHMNQTLKPLLVSTCITLVLTPLWKYYGIIR